VEGDDGSEAFVDDLEDVFVRKKICYTRDDTPGVELLVKVFVVMLEPRLLYCLS